jgi:2-amino-4-hydroxy-6-hydroxymethyldihydropteridine diphosphokinase
MLARMVIAYIALGSNLGRRKSAIAAALAHLDTLPDSRIVAVAAFRETLPVDAPPLSGTFINTAAGLSTMLAPIDLLQELLRIERLLGRVRGDVQKTPLLRNAPRVIDLDLILYGGLVLDSPQLAIPHPRMHLRGFVLEPLAEVAPDVVHPIMQKTIQELWADWRGAGAPRFTEERV